jgi:hypothetical protein
VFVISFGKAWKEVMQVGGDEDDAWGVEVLRSGGQVRGKEEGEKRCSEVVCLKTAELCEL